MNERKSRGPIGVIFLTVLIDLIGFSIIFPLFPELLDHYLEKDGGSGMLAGLIDKLHEISGTESGADGAPSKRVITLFGGLLTSLYAILQFVFAPFWGSLSDRVGRRPILLLTISGIAISYLLWFFSGSFLVLVISRLLGGIMSGNISTATAAMADVTTAENRAKGMGLVGAAFGLGFIVGPAIGGAICAGVDMTEVLPGLVPYGVNPFSAAALAAFILSVINLVWVLRSFEETLTDEARARAQQSGRSINPIRLLSPVDLAGVNATNYANFLFVFAFSGMEFSLTFLGVDRFAFSIWDCALLLSFAGFVMAFVQGGLIRRLAPRLGEVKLVRFGLVIIIPGLVAVGLAASVAVLYLGVFLLAVGAAMVIPGLRALTSLYTPEHRQGEVIGIFNSLGALARAAGPITCALLYWKYDAKTAYLMGAASIVLPLAVTLLLRQPTKEAAADK